MNIPVADAKAINELLARYGVKFGIYKNGTFNEQLFPFDAIPRIISAEDFSDMEKGLMILLLSITTGRSGEQKRFRFIQTLQTI